MFLVDRLNPAGYFSLCHNLGKRKFCKGREFLHYFLSFSVASLENPSSCHFQIPPLLPISENSLTECKPANRNCLLGWKFCVKYIKDGLPMLTRKSGTFISPFITFIRLRTLSIGAWQDGWGGFRRRDPAALQGHLQLGLSPSLVWKISPPGVHFLTPFVQEPW